MAARCALACEAHPDPTAEAIRWSICEAEVIQAIGRGVNRTTATPLQIDPLTDVVLPVTVDELLTRFRYKVPDERRAVRTTNFIERRFLEVRRRTRPMGVASGRTSMYGILCAVFSYENRNQGTITPSP